VCDREVDYRVAEELEPLVRAAWVTPLVDVGAVEERLLEELGRKL
jgi:hypothetical protein